MHGRTAIGQHVGMTVRGGWRLALAALTLSWLVTWVAALAWFDVAGDGYASGLPALMVAGTLLLAMPLLAGALVGWSRQGHAPVEPELGPVTVRYFTITENLAAAAGAGMQALNFAVMLVVDAVQSDPPPTGQAASWWEPLLVFLLCAIAGFVLGLIGGILGGLLAAGWRRLHYRPM